MNRAPDPSFFVNAGASLSPDVLTNSAAHMTAINTYYNNCIATYKSGGGFFNESDEVGRFWVSGRMGWGPHITTLKGPNSGPGCASSASITNAEIKEPSSYHPGGVQVLRADASVTFMSETIDQSLWIALGSIRGKETVQMP